MRADVASRLPTLSKHLHVPSRQMPGGILYRHTGAVYGSRHPLAPTQKGELRCHSRPALIVLSVATSLQLA